MAKNKSKHKWLLHISLLAALAIGLSLLVWFTRITPPDPATATDQQKIDFLSSDSFTKMSSKRQSEYLDKIIPDSGTPFMPLLLNNDIPVEQRNRLMKNTLPVITPRIKERFDEYEKMTPQQQIVQLDQIIDGFLQRQTMPGQNISPQRMALALQYMDPYLRSKFRKHIPDLVNRMSQRGIIPKNGLFDNLINK